MREPEGVPVIRWRCTNPGCRKSYASRSRAREHAAICPKDPDNRACLTCQHFHDGEAGGWEYPGSDPSCNKGLEIGRPMPRDCPAWVRRTA